MKIRVLELEARNTRSPLRFFCWILMSFAMITVANYKLTSTQLLHSCCQIVKGCLLYTRIPITWCMYPSTKRRASSDNLVPETDSMHPVIQLHFSIQLRIEPENDRRVSIIPGSHSALEFPCPKLLVRNKRYLIRHTYIVVNVDE